MLKPHDLYADAWDYLEHNDPVAYDKLQADNAWWDEHCA